VCTPNHGVIHVHQTFPDCPLVGPGHHNGPRLSCGSRRSLRVRWPRQDARQREGPAADAAPGTKRKQRSSGTSYSVGAGYRFNPFLAAEGSFDNTVGNRRSRDPGTANLSSRSLTLGGLALIPIGDHVELFGKVAVGSRQQSFLPPKGTEIKTTRQRKFATTPSVGANVYLTDALALRAEYTIPMSANKKVQQAAGVEKIRLNNWYVGMSYAF